MKIEPVILEGKFVRLEPLSLETQFEDLCEAGLDADLWKWTSDFIQNAAELRIYFERALDEQRRGVSLPFATIEKQTNKAVGSTRFGNIEANHRRVEIGWTWISQKWQRTFVNTEAKYLMLKHAFDVWNCRRVELKTDALNARSRAAISRLGATEEGILRKHMITATGRVRDTVYFSILDDEWQQIKANLEAKLAQSQQKEY